MSPASSPRIDPRLVAARPDLADETLRATFTAQRYVKGEKRRISATIADLHQAPTPDAPIVTQALYGENVRLFEDDEGWGWVQLESDAYVGYLAMTALAEDTAPPTHILKVLRSFIYPGRSIKLPPLMALPLGASVTVVEIEGEFARLAKGGFMFAAHLAPIGTQAPDFVAVAESFIGVPYLWGGKSSLGIDCSGLVQLSMRMAEHKAPRDTDMQAALLGTAVAEHAALQRGDLVFWKGHVGIMRDASTLLHANAHHMLVASEPLEAARSRIFEKGGGAVIAIKRL